MKIKKINMMLKKDFNELFSKWKQGNTNNNKGGGFDSSEAYHR